MYDSFGMITCGLDQKRSRLKSIEEEGDVDGQIASLADQAVNLNVQRLNNAIEIKVKLSFVVYVWLILIEDV